MHIYFLKQAVCRYQHLMLVNDIQWDDLLLFNGSPLPEDFPQIEAQLIDEDRFRPLSDSPHLSPGVPVFSPRAVEALMPLLKPCGELVELDCLDGRYYLYNVTHVINALDEKRSICSFFEDGTVMHIERYAFRFERLRDAIVFKIPQVPRSIVFCTQSFVDAVTAAGLVGFHFPPVPLVD